MSLNMDLNKTPDLQDFLTMEPDLDAIKRSTSPVTVGIPISQNSSQIMTPAKLHMHGEPLQKGHSNENDSDGNATDTTVSAGSIDEMLDGIKSPSPATAAAMENLLADDELTSSIPGSSPMGQLPTITAKMTSSTAAVIKPEPTIKKTLVTRSFPSTLAGKMIAVTTSNRQPLQIIKKAGGGGPIVTKYILKPATNVSGLAASKSGQKVMVATTLKSTLKPVVKSPIKKLTQSGSNIVLSPIKGGFKIPISPMKSPIKVSVLGNASTKLQNIINAVPSTEVGRVHQYKVTPQGNISVQMQAPNSNNGMITKTFSMQQPIFLQQKPTQTVVGQNKTNQSNAVIQQVIPTNQAIRVDTSGMKYQYVQIVNPSQSTSKSQGHPISVSGNNIPINNPLTVIQQAPSFQKIQQNRVKSTPQTLKVSVANPSAGQQQQAKQRLIMPATSMPPLRPNFANVQSNSIITGADNVRYAMVPAKYVEQLNKINSQQQFNQENNNQHSPTAIIRQQPPTQLKTSAGKLKKPCNCTKSQCLKLYCECFANGHFCDGCNCNNCFNNLEHEHERSKAIKLCLERNQNAFKPKIGRGKDDHRTHQKGCNCKRSGCLKNYCECYEARIPCTSKCKCIGCKNYEETGDRRSLMSLADAAEVRERQQMAAKSKLSSQIGDLRVMSKPITPSGERLPYTFFTQEVIEATCTCLLAQAEEAEKTNRSMSVAETMILEEFGRCLMQIIQSAGKAKVTNLT